MLLLVLLERRGGVLTAVLVAAGMGSVSDREQQQRQQCVSHDRLR